MDRRLKERLIGATILAVLVILVVPELLSGPKGPVGPAADQGAASESIRNVKVDVTTRRTTASDEQRASAPPSPSGPPAANSSAAPADAGSRTAATPESSGDAPGRPTITTLRAQPPAAGQADKAAPDPDAAPAAAHGSPSRAAPAPPGPQHGWAVQIGSFASRANAEKQMHHLKALDESAYLTVSGAGRSLRYKVRVGPFADRVAADKAVARLKKNGESANLIPP